ncbi:Uncharacterized protein Adt_26778 [Abeliophyllum distichum]|uniref:Uncharacterized protein n=1 Tax=Abeliophyllum distichum TaxID=126358 RepID=A0ABD1RRW1_9LAMI
MMRTRLWVWTGSKGSWRTNMSVLNDSTAASNTPQETSNQFCEDARNDGPQFTKYEAQLRQMERTIARLMTNLEYRLPGVVLDNDEKVGEDETNGGVLENP